MGAALIVISPEQPARTSAMAIKQKLTFPILWDENSDIAEAFGLAFSLPDDLRDVYKAAGIDLPAANGGPTWRLPVPSRFVIDGSGIVSSVEADPDYKYRPEPEATLEVLRRVVNR